MTADPDAIVHFAGATLVPESVREPLLYYGINAGGSINVQRVSTSASGRLGEWFEIGAMAQSSNSTSSGILSSNSAERQENRRVWVKVEQLR